MNEKESKVLLDAANLLFAAGRKLKAVARNKKSPEAEQPGKSEECASRGKDHIKAGSGRKASRWNVPELIAAYKSGRTLEDLGQEHGVTRERIRQILVKSGITRNDGGQHVVSEKRKEEWSSKRDARFLKRTGMPREQWKALRGSHWKFSPQKAFIEKKRNIDRLEQGVWQMNFADWWKVWEESGKWPEHGLGAKKYCMTRKDKTLPWTADNVKIETLEVICSDTIHETAERLGYFPGSHNLRKWREAK
jgi:hypothetical protein